MPVEILTISRRFCGPSKSGNGGYVCGRIARHISGPATVKLRIPPPIEVPLQIERSEGIVKLLHGTEVVGEGGPAELNIAPPEALTYAEAEAASHGFLGFSKHSFPRCFVCGPLRQERDGMRIFAGPVSNRQFVAAPWIVDASLADGGHVPSEFVWAALDCPSAFAVMPVADGVAIVLGQLTAHVNGSVRPAEKCTVIAWPIAIDGRKRHSGSAVYSESGTLVASARAIWIEVPESAFPPESAT